MDMSSRGTFYVMRLLIVTNRSDELCSRYVLYLCLCFMFLDPRNWSVLLVFVEESN